MRIDVLFHKSKRSVDLGIGVGQQQRAVSVVETDDCVVGCELVGTVQEIEVCVGLNELAHAYSLEKVISGFAVGSVPHIAFGIGFLCRHR